MCVHLSIPTVDRDLARRLEPRAPTPRKRMEAVRRLGEAGVAAGVFCAPILPLITDSEESIGAVFQAAREARARFVMTNVLFLYDASRRTYLRRIDEGFPQVAPRFRALYGDRAHAPDGYRSALDARIAALRARYGLASYLEREDSRSHEAAIQATFRW